MPYLNRNEPRTSEVWMTQLGHIIIDADGWNNHDGVSFTDTPISFEDYMARYHKSTVRIYPPQVTSRLSRG